MSVRVVDCTEKRHYDEIRYKFGDTDDYLRVIDGEWVELVSGDIPPPVPLVACEDIDNLIRALEMIQSEAIKKEWEKNV